MVNNGRETDLAAAYRDQVARDTESAATEGQLMGYKVALSHTAGQRALGLEAPALAPIRMNSVFSSGRTLGTAWAEPKLEIELALRLLNFDRPQLVSAVPAFEVIAGPVASDGLEFIRTGAAFGAAVLGSTPVPVPNATLARLEARIYADGELVHRAPLTSDLGGPIEALAWLSDELEAQHRPLKAGMIVMSGAAGAGIPLRAGVGYCGVITDGDRQLGEVSTRWDPTQG